MEEVHAILSSSFTSQSSILSNETLVPCSTNEYVTTRNQTKDVENNDFDEELEELTAVAIRSFVKDVRSSIASGKLRKRSSNVPDIRTLLLRTIDNTTDKSVDDDTTMDEEDEEEKYIFNQRMVDRALAELESETMLSALEQEASDRQHSPWLYNAPEIASTVHTPSSLTESEARQSARDKLVQWFGKLGYTPNTVGLSHIPKPLRMNRATKIIERENGGPMGYTLPTVTEEIDRFRIRPANGYKTNHKFSNVPRFMDHYKGNNAHHHPSLRKENNESFHSPTNTKSQRPLGSSPLETETDRVPSKGDNHNTPVLFNLKKSQSGSPDTLPPYVSPENDEEWKDITIISINDELNPKNRSNRSPSIDISMDYHSLNMSICSAPDRIGDNYQQNSKNMDADEIKEDYMDLGENFGYDWVWDTDNEDTVGYSKASASVDNHLKFSPGIRDLIPQNDRTDYNSNDLQINEYIDRSDSDMDDTEWDNIEMLDNKNFWSTEEATTTATTVSLPKKKSDKKPNRPPSAPPSQSSRYTNTLSTTLLDIHRSSKTVESSSLSTAPFTLPGSTTMPTTTKNIYSVWAKNEANKLRNIARERFYGSAYKLRQRLSQSVRSTSLSHHASTATDTSIDPTLYFRKLHPGSISYTIAPPIDAHAALTDEEYFRLCLVRARQKRGYNIGIQNALSRDIYRALRMFEKRSHGGLPFGPDKTKPHDQTDQHNNNHTRAKFYRLARYLLQKAQYERSIEAINKEWERKGRQGDPTNADPFIHRTVSMRGRQPVTWKRATELETIAHNTREASLRRKGTTSQSIWYATQLHQIYDVGIESWRKAGLRSHRKPVPSSPTMTTTENTNDTSTNRVQSTLRSRSADPRYQAHARPDIPVPLFATLYSSSSTVTRSLSPSTERYRKHHVRYLQPNRIKADEFKDRLPIRSDHIQLSADLGKTRGRERKVAVRNKQTLGTEIVSIPFTAEPNKVNEILGPLHTQPGPADYFTEDPELLFRTSRHRPPPRVFIGETTGRKDNSHRTKEDPALTTDLDYAFGGDRFGKYALTTENTKEGTPKEGEVVDLDPMRAYDRPSQRKYLPSYTFGKGTSGREPETSVNVFDLFDDEELRPIGIHKNNKQSTTYDALHVKEISRKINKALRVVESEHTKQLQTDKIRNTTEKIIKNSYINTVGQENFPNMIIKKDTPPKVKIPLSYSSLPSRYTTNTSPTISTTISSHSPRGSISASSISIPSSRPPKTIGMIPSVHSQYSTRSSVPNRYTQVPESSTLSSYPSVHSLSSTVPSNSLVVSSSSLYDGMMENNNTGTLNYSKHMLSKKQIYQ